MHTYDTVSAATNGLRERGYTLDFNLEENCLICSGNKYNPDDFEIVEIHRFEGMSDPADSAIVYGIKSIDGKKGVLVNGYGISANPLTSAMAKKLSVHHE